MRTYNLNYNTQYFFNNIVLKSEVSDIDIYFLGANKGRSCELLKLEKSIKDLGFKTLFYVTGCKKRGNMKRISYEKNLENISKSKVILDYVSENQSGLTIRPLEALFLNKKLVTNDKTIKKRDFYHPNNIFVLENNNIIDLHCFLQSALQEIPSDIKNKYDFNNWLSRFFN